MVTPPPAEYSNGAPYVGEGHGGADWGVPEDDARNRIRQHLPRGMTMEDLECFLRERIMQAHHLEQPTDDVEAEIRATIWNMARSFADPRPLRTPLQELRARRTLLSAEGGTVGVDASGSTVVHGNARGVHVAARPGTNVYAAPGGEVYMPAAAGFVTHMTAGGASGGGLIQPLLLFSNPSGTINGAPRSSGDGVAGRYLALTVRRAFPVGDGEPPYLGGGELAVTDFFPVGDGEPPYLVGGELAVTDFYPVGDGETAYLGGRALAVTDFFPVGDGETPYLGGGAPAVMDFFPRGDGENPYFGGWAPNPSVVRDGGGANARDQHVIDIPLAPPATGTADRGLKYLEKLLFGFLPASVIALVPLSGASDNVKLVTFTILAMLIVLLVVGMSSRASAKQVVRLSACAGIFAMTVLVSTQLSRGIDIAIAAFVGVALCGGITLAM